MALAIKLKRSKAKASKKPAKKATAKSTPVSDDVAEYQAMLAQKKSDNVDECPFC